MHASSTPGENPVQLQQPGPAVRMRRKRERTRNLQNICLSAGLCTYYIITGCQMNVTLVLFLFPPKIEVHRGRWNHYDFLKLVIYFDKRCWRSDSCGTLLALRGKALSPSQGLRLKKKGKETLAFHNMSQSAAAGGEGKWGGQAVVGASGIVTTLVSYKVLINTL